LTRGFAVLNGAEPLPTSGRSSRGDAGFRIASITKPIAGAAVRLLVQDGQPALDDPVERWLPELADRRVLRNLAAVATDMFLVPPPGVIRNEPLKSCEVQPA
jgi:CubicO group peptidase (beta-lactamase class C family)